MDWNTYTTDLNIPNNWECTSYHHDELPSWQVNGLHIWIDSHDPKVRTANAKYYRFGSRFYAKVYSANG